MKKILIALIILIFFSTAAVIFFLLFTGPRMRVQVNIRPFQIITPVMSPGSVPVNAPYGALPDRSQAEKLKNPIPFTTENYSKGKVYYGYYCAFCHGDMGDGFGPVGYSYVPVPSDLRTDKVQNQSDGLLLVSMLTGTGHSPMHERIVLPQYRWYIVLYLRQIALSSGTSSLSSSTINASPQ